MISEITEIIGAIVVCSSIFIITIKFILPTVLADKNEHDFAEISSNDETSSSDEKLVNYSEFPDKECDDSCFCSEDIKKDDINNVDNTKKTDVIIHNNKQLKNMIIISAALAEPAYKKRYKRL